MELDLDEPFELDDLEEPDERDELFAAGCERLRELDRDDLYDRDDLAEPLRVRVVERTERLVLLDCVVLRDRGS